jgi:hypothetical protein
MKLMDCVELIVEKNKYAKEGVHKGMQGVIWDSERKDGAWVVLFPQYGEQEDIADLYINEEDLRLLPDGIDPKINEQIKAKFECTEDTAKSHSNTTDDISGYLV